MRNITLLAALSGLHLTGCTPLDSSDVESDSTVVSGVYVLDGNLWSGQASHVEWELNPSGSFSISRFTWNSATQSGCVDSRTGSGKWSSSEGELQVTISSRRTYRLDCDSTWRDTSNSPSGSFRYRVRTDSTGFSWFDSSAGSWHSMYKL